MSAEKGQLDVEVSNKWLQTPILHDKGSTWPELQIASVVKSV